MEEKTNVFAVWLGGFLINEDSGVHVKWADGSPSMIFFYITAMLHQFYFSF